MQVDAPTSARSGRYRLLLAHMFPLEVAGASLMHHEQGTQRGGHEHLGGYRGGTITHLLSSPP
jgi:hypothetical protein